MGVEAIPPLPRHLQLEITSACNLSCATCLVRYRPAVGRAEGAMPFEHFRELVDGAPRLERLTQQGLGEPLLHPRIDEMVAYAKGRGIRVGFNSNGMLLTRRRAERMVAMGHDWLHVSLDGATAEPSRASATDRASLDRVTCNLAGLQRPKRAAGAALPWVRVVFVAMRRNIGELADTVRMVSELGVDELRVQGLSHDLSDRPGRRLRRHPGLRRGRGPGRRRPGRGRGGARRGAAGGAPPGPLSAPAGAGAGRAAPAPRRARLLVAVEAAYVTSGGTVQPCCMAMGDDRVSMGSVRDAELAEIWSGEAYAGFCAALRGDAPPAVCVGCALYRGTF